MGFKQWLSETTLEVDGAEVSYDLINGIPVIVGFDRLKWMNKGVIEKAVDAVKRHANADVVKTSSGIRQHWQHAGYNGH